MISGDIDGIIHRQSLLLRGVRVLVLFVLFVFTKERCSVHILLHTLSYLDKKNTQGEFFRLRDRFLGV